MCTGFRYGKEVKMLTNVDITTRNQRQEAKRVFIYVEKIKRVVNSKKRREVPSDGNN